jgi:hypothetical protein
VEEGIRQNPALFPWKPKRICAVQLLAEGELNDVEIAINGQGLRQKSERPLAELPG